VINLIFNIFLLPRGIIKNYWNYWMTLRIKKWSRTFQLAAKFIDKIKVYCYRTPCIFRTTYKALFMSSYIVHFQQIMRCLSRTLSRSNESHLCRHLNVSILPSACPSREDARSIAVGAIILPRAFNAMPSVTIVVELSHTLDLMDSRRLLRPRPWNLLEISSSPRSWIFRRNSVNI